jgi:hypothetical protein
VSTLPLATLTSVTATRAGNHLIIHVEGYTPGFGGEFVVERSPNRSLPQIFDVRSSPGNIGTPGDPDLRSFTTGTFCFSAGGIGNEIRIISADNDETIEVSELDPTQENGDWTATLNLFPRPEKPLLSVKGSVEIPSPQHEARLERAAPQGINPKILILYTVITPPQGIHIPEMSRSDVEYTETTEVRYESVTILPQGIYIEVEELH